MGKRIGTLLEKDVEKMFRLAGFETKRNTVLEGYEIDVLAEWNNLKIIIQCKQYERARLNVQDVIHEWNSKNQIIKADKVVIVVFGQDPEEWQRNLANQFNIALWGEKDMDDIDNLVIERGQNSLGEMLGILNLKEPLEEYPSRQNNYSTIGLVFVVIFFLLFAIIFPPVIIPFIVGIVIWIIIKSKKKRNRIK